MDVTKISREMLESGGSGTIGGYLPSIVDFGGIDGGPGVDNTAAFEALAAYCGANRCPGFIPAAVNGFATQGDHVFNHGLVGVGGWASTIIHTHASNTLIRTTNQSPGLFHGINYKSSVVRTAGATIAIDAPTGTLAYTPTISGNIFEGGWIDINLVRANAARIVNNTSFDWRRHFIQITNVDFPDNGDHHICGNVFDTSMSATAGAGIMQYNAGGCRIISNKAGRGTHAYELNLTGTPPDSTSILLIEGNSFENQSIGQIRLRRAPGATASFLHVVINGNQFAGSPAGNSSIQLDDSQEFISNVLFTNNIVQFQTAGVTVTSAKSVMIAHNVFQSFGGGVGVQSGGTATGRIGHNVFNNVATPVANSAAGMVVTG